MALTGTRTYVGFGFGAIQAGLFLYEAFRSGGFRRLVVAEVLPEVVASIRGSGGFYRVNIAHVDGVEHARVGPIEIENPSVEEDRRRLIAAIAEAPEIGTAIPSVNLYATPATGSLHQVLAAGLRGKIAAGGPPAVIYTAENHNRAAEILESKVLEEVTEGERPAVLARCQFLNTVIGKMSGVAADPQEIQRQNLAPVHEQDRRAFLVEDFNRILISRIRLGGGAGFQRGLAVFEEKEDLLPFEEAKLYGHNATHALAAYTAALRGDVLIADLRAAPGAMPFLRAAFIEESGGPLVEKYSGLDPLFTHQGYRQYADDLLRRMTNPYLRDTVERVGRDPRRKLGWDDRLIGTMRLALRRRIEPQRYAFGAAAALAALDQKFLASAEPAEMWLEPIWGQAQPLRCEKEKVLRHVEAGRRHARRWREGGFRDLELLFHADAF